MLKNREPVFFCNFKEGQVQVYKGKRNDGAPIKETWDLVEGVVKSIQYHESMYKDEIIKSWKIKIVDKNEVYFLSVPHSSGFARGFFNSLASANINKLITFGCYVKNEYNQPSLRQNDKVLKWKYPDMPKSDKVEVGKSGKFAYDDTKVIEWIEGIITLIEGEIDPLSKSEQKSVEDFDSYVNESVPAPDMDVPF